MFGKSKVSKSMIDAVNSVIGEEPVVSTKQPTRMLSEKEEITPETLRGKILKQKDDKKAELGKSSVALSVEELIAQKNAIPLNVQEHKLSDDAFINAVTKAIYGERNVQIEAATQTKKKMLADDELDETGFHMAAHAAKKSGQNKFEFQGKHYPVTAKSHTEEYELDEEGNCVTPMKAKKIADKEVGKHEKEMHKEGMTFKDRLLEKSVSTKQARTMAAAAHNPKFAKKVGIPQDVAKDFNQADKGTKMLSKAMSEEEVLDEKDELRSRIGTNIVNKKPREGQTDLRNIPVGNRPDSKRTFSQGERDSQPSRLKNDIKASLGKHTKPNLPEESEMNEKDELRGRGAVKEAAKWRDPKHKDKLYTQEPRDPHDSYQSDDDYYNPKPDDYPGAKNLKGGSEYRHNDPLRTGYGRYGVGSLNTHGKRKGMPSRDHITSLKGSIKDAHGKHTKPNLPEESEMQESLKDVAKKILHKVGGGSDKDQLKKLQKNMGVPQTGEKPKNEEVKDEYARKVDEYLKKKYKKEEVVDEAAESPFTSYKDKTKPSIFAPKSHTSKKSEKGTVYTKNWSKKDMEHKADDKAKNEAVDKEADQHVRVDGETDMKTKTVDGLRGRMKVPADYHNKSKSYKVALTVGEETELSEENDSHTHAAHYEDPKTGEWNGMKLITAKDDEDAIKQAHSNCEDGCRLSKVERHKTIKKEAMEHPDEKEDKALVKKMVKKDALKKTDEAFKGPEAGSGTGDHPFVTSEAKPLQNARELAKKTMHRLKNEMLGKIAN